MPSNIKENGFETMIVNHLVQVNGYEQGYNNTYNASYALDEERLFRFLKETQPKQMEELQILGSDLEKERFFKQLDKKLRTNGVIDLLRNGMRYKHLHLELFYVRPSADRMRQNFMQRISSASPGSCSIQNSIQDWLWICVFSLMACRS